MMRSGCPWLQPGITYIAAVHLDAEFVEPGHILAFEREHPCSIATIEKRLDYVHTEQAGAARHEHFHVVSSFTGDQCRQRYVRSATLGTSCSNQAIA